MTRDQSSHIARRRFFPLAAFQSAYFLLPFIFCAALSTRAGLPPASAPATSTKDYKFDKTISREVLENYLSRSITMEGLLNGRGDLDDNIRMLKNIDAKFVGRSLCLWGHEADL